MMTLILLGLLLYVVMGFCTSMMYDLYYKEISRTTGPELLFVGVIWPVVSVKMLIPLIFFIPVLLVKGIKDYQANN